MEGHPPAEHLIHHYAQGVNVGASIQLVAPHARRLLTGHVGGVPSTMPVCVCVLDSRSLAMPKSTTLTMSSPSSLWVRKMLSGLRSR